jgi:hypothetical protein
VPPSLVRFALEQVKHAVLEGTGPLRSGKQLEPLVVGEADVALLRRILYAFGGEGSMAVTPAEAEVLFDIDAVTAGRDNHPDWCDLFVKAIASCVMAASGYAAPPREVALAREAWLDRRGDLSLDNVLSGMVTGFKPMLDEYRAQSGEERAIARLTQQKIEIITHEAVTAAEASWLAARIARDGTLSPNERALLVFLKAESPSIDPALQKLVDEATAMAA